MAECIRDGNAIVCSGNIVGGVQTADSVSVNVRYGTQIVNIPDPEPFGTCPVSPPVIYVGHTSTVINNGTLTGFGLCAATIIVGDHSRVTNNGSLTTTGTVANAIEIGRAGIVSHKGAITTFGDLSYGVSAQDNAFVTTENGSTLITYGAAAAGLFLGKNATIINNGLILTTALDASTIDLPQDIFSSTPTFASIVNTGRLESLGPRAVAVRAGADSISLTNRGVINATFRESPNIRDYALAVNLTGGTIQTANSGVILGAVGGFEATATQAISLENSGSISAFAGIGRAVDLKGSSVSLLNSGLISGRLSAIHAEAVSSYNISNTGIIETTDGISTEANPPVVEVSGPRLTNGTISNSGTIAAPNGRTALRTGDANDLVINAGNIFGDVHLGNGDDVLIMRDGAKLQGTLDGGAGNDRLLLADRGTLNWEMENIEDLVMLGDHWYIAKDVTLARTLAIVGGELSIANGHSINTPRILVDTSTRLSGDGTVTGQVLGAGTLAPGPGGATLRIVGSWTADHSGALEIDIDPSGSNSKLAVTGQAQIAGTLVVRLPAGQRQRGTTQYEFLTATQGVTGLFDSVIGVNSTFTKSYVIKSPDATSLSLLVTRIPYKSAAITQSQNSVATALDLALDSGRTTLSPLFDRLDSLTKSAATTALDQLASRATIKNKHTVLAASRMIHVNIRSALKSTEIKALSAPRRIWGQASNGNGRTRRFDDSDNYAFDTQSISAGVENTFQNGARFGLALSRQAGHISSFLSVAQLSNLAISSYAEQELYDFQLATGLTLGKGHTSNVRTLPQSSFGMFGGDLISSSNVSQLGGFLSAAQTYNLGRVTLRPHTGVDIWHLHVAAANEVGILGLNYAKQALLSARAELGVELNAKHEFIQPFLALDTSQELAARDKPLRASFRSDPNASFEIAGPTQRRFWLTAATGFTAQLQDGAALKVAYTGNLRDSTQGRAISARISIDW